MKKNRDLLEKIPWHTALERKGIQKRWLIFTSSNLGKGPSQQVGNQARWPRMRGSVRKAPSEEFKNASEKECLKSSSPCFQEKNILPQSSVDFTVPNLQSLKIFFFQNASYNLSSPFPIGF